LTPNDTRFRRGTREFVSRVPAENLTNYGRGGGVGRGLGVGTGLGGTVAVAVAVGVAVAVAVAVGVGEGDPQGLTGQLKFSAKSVGTPLVS